ncbi:MAG: hypothetical protein JWQ21_3944 [Herminiimonas sp.]|nr:hypothetical protein [Herminiimonas sp.]
MPRDSFPHSDFPGGERSSAGRQLPSAAPYRTVLEKDFPHILMVVQKLWGYPELNVYFRRFVSDNQGDRAEFPEEAREEIFTLLSLHQALVPDSF